MLLPALELHTQTDDKPKGRGVFRVPEVPIEGPSCQTWLLGIAASFVSPYAAADLSKTALKGKGERPFREDEAGQACPLST